MKLNKYQELAIRTANTGALTRERNLINAAMGVFDEAGEAVEPVKKYSFQGHELDKTKLKKELGDALWYIALAAYCLDLNLDECTSYKLENKNFEELESNIEILRGFYLSNDKALGLNQNLTPLETAALKFQTAAGKFNADVLYLTPRTGASLCTTLYFWAIFAKECGLSLDEIATENIKKLEARYPNGCF